MGVSGCDKTQTNYEVLCSRLSLFYISSIKGNGSSNDLKTMMRSLELEVNQFKLQTQLQEPIEDAGSCHYFVLLLARLLTLEEFTAETNLYLIANLWFKQNPTFSCLQITRKIYLQPCINNSDASLLQNSL
jgi:hypothetical protein